MRRVSRGRITKKIRGQAPGRIDCLSNEITKKEFRNRDGESDSGADSVLSPSKEGQSSSEHAELSLDLSLKRRHLRKGSQEPDDCLRSIHSGNPLSIMSQPQCSSNPPPTEVLHSVNHHVCM